MSSNRITSGAVLLIGDIHLSDKFKGQHHDYKANCYRIMEQIEDMVQEVVSEHKHCTLIFLGDLFGVQEKRFTTRSFLLEVLEFFQNLNTLTHNRVYSVRGNHDINHTDLSDFEVFNRLGMIKVLEKNSDGTFGYLDFCNAESTLRFHFINYGEEMGELSNNLEGVNVGLGHNDFGLPGHQQPFWRNSTERAVGEEMYNLDKNWDIEEMENLYALDYLISGHLHHPNFSGDFTLPDGSTIAVIYPGSPSRVSIKEDYDECSALLFTLEDKDSFNLATVPFDLVPASVEFIPRVQMIDEFGSSNYNHEIEDIVNMLSQYRSVDKNVMNQIQSYPDIPDEVKVLACSLLQDEMDKSIDEN